MKTLNLIIALSFIAGAIFYSTNSNSTITEKDALIIENIEALTNTESPVHIPCFGLENERCKFLSVGSDSVWRHIEIENMKHE